MWVVGLAENKANSAQQELELGLGLSLAITFFGVYSKMAEKRIFLIFVDLYLNFCKASQVRVFSPHVRASLHGSL